MLNREQILGANDLASEIVDVPEWGGQVRVGMMSGTARDQFEASILTNDRTPDLVNMRAKLVAFCLLDENGAQMFTLADVVALGGKSAAALDRVAKVAQRLNRLGNSDLEELKGN